VEFGIARQPQERLAVVRDVVTGFLDDQKRRYS
jgi:hypothetical protein